MSWIHASIVDPETVDVHVRELAGVPYVIVCAAAPRAGDVSVYLPRAEALRRCRALAAKLLAAADQIEAARTPSSLGSAS